MATPNAYFIKPKLGFWEETRLYLAHELHHPLNAILYVPDKFVLGSFEEKGIGLEFSPSNFHYSDYEETLEEYQRAIADKRLEIVQELVLPENLLESLAQQGRECKNIKNMFRKQAQSLNNLSQALEKKYSANIEEMV